MFVLVDLKCLCACLRERERVKGRVSAYLCICMCVWLKVYVYNVVYAESTVSSPWWSTYTQTARYTLLSTLVKCLPPCLCFRFFHQKRKWKIRSCVGEGGGDWWWKWERKSVGEWERETGGRCSHLELLHGYFIRGSAVHTAPFEFIGSRRWRKRWRQTGRVRVRLLTVSYGTCTSSLIIITSKGG